MGDGYRSAIIPASTVNEHVNILELRPDPKQASYLTSIEGIHIGDPATGQRNGNHGVYLNSQDPGAHLAKFTIRDCFIGQGHGRAIFHLNSSSANPNGGLFGALIENNVLRGGIELANSGDSNAIRANIISGEGPGVIVSLVSGASLLIIDGNNITSKGGAVRIDGGSRFRVLNNNCEQTAPGGSNGAMIDINGMNDGTMWSGTIQGNHLGAFQKSGITSIIRLRHCQGCWVEQNVLLPDSPKTVGIDISESSDTRIGANTFGKAIQVPILDHGIGTMGVFHPAVLRNGWQIFDSQSSAPGYIKSPDGRVHLSGFTRGGLVKPGTLLFALPSQFTPEKIERFLCLSLNTAQGAALGAIQIDPTGNVTLLAGGSEGIQLTGLSFMASGGAHTFSRE